MSNVIHRVNHLSNRHLNRRHVLLALAAAPVGCAIRPLAPLATQPIAAPQGAAMVRPPQVGQAWTYRQLNHFNGETVAVVRETVASVGARVVVQRQIAAGVALPDEHHATWGQLLRDPVWDYPLNLEQPVPLWPSTLSAGQPQRVDAHFREDGGSYRSWIQVYLVVKGWERVALALGNFDTLRVERLIRLQHNSVTRLETLRRDVLWLAPEVGRWVLRETSGRYREPEDDRLGGGEYLEDHFRWELTAWQ